jgi:uncharacterized protein Yka (UPF0111/DUF47 family)
MASILKDRDELAEFTKHLSDAAEALKDTAERIRLPEKMRDLQEEVEFISSRLLELDPKA